ncbi:hypothetical protein [Parasitella parasitica]|uniref:Polar growth protein n=1 Tax=Parasitella parasitica TaxID=35722 RepID=A0A0B7NCT6_9FUNG|nr:hypothetical protein [Parasitella parasitica]
MPQREVVYTIHKFEAENADEISINVGEQVIVIEKDEGYNDGWWQGRNVRGETGLFPITYTSKQPPSAALNSLEKSLSKSKANDSTQQKKMTSSVSCMSSISSKNIYSTVIQSLENPSLSSKVEEWNSDQVATWLMSIGFDKQLADTFKDQEISGDVLLELTLESLKEIDVPTFGKRFKIHNAISALRQEMKKRRRRTSTSPLAVPNKNIQTRAASPFPDLSSRSNNALSSYYNSNKQQQPYPDDDLVSGYSTVMRDSQLSQHKAMPPPRPSAPPNLNSFMSSPQLSNLAKPQPVDRHQPNYYNDKQQQQQQQQRRPAPACTNSTSNEMRSTTNNIKTQEVAPLEGRSSTSSRYSFIRSSLLPSGNKLQNILPANAPNVLRSDDTFSLSDASAPPDMEGWLYKQGDKYKTWNKRWFVLKENNLFYFKNPKAMRLKGIINLKGYRIEVDESIHPGKYCFMAHHERERTFFFYTEFERPMKDWLKALMKATIVRDFTTPVMSSNTIPTVSLEVARKMRPRPPSTIFVAQNDPLCNSSPAFYRNSLNQHFSLMALDKQAQAPLQQDMLVNGSRAPSAMSSQPIDQKRVLLDNASEYSIDQRSRLKDSGFNSTHGGGVALARSATESSHSSSGRHSMSMVSLQQQPNSVIAAKNGSAFYFDEEDEDLIDPDHMSIAESNRLMNKPYFSVATTVKPEKDETLTRKDACIGWINANIRGSVQSLSELGSGEILLEFLENLTKKQILRPIVMPGQTINAQRMDRVITAFKFMSLEGVEIDGSCTIRDVLNSNEAKIMNMLDAVEYWHQTKTKGGNGKKTASGGTFGEDDQCKLRELQEGSGTVLVSNSCASR